MPYIKSLSGINWFYQLKGKGRALVFIHGWSFDSNIWLRQISDFNNYKIVALDLPGHGNSGYKPGIDVIEELSFAFKKLELENFNLVGHSFGGTLALRFSNKYPDVVKKMILISTAPKFVKSQDYGQGLEEREISKLRGFLAENYPDILSVFMRWLFTEDERKKSDLREIWNLITKRPAWPKKEALGEYLSIIEKEDLRGILKEINIPTLIISGENDPICPNSSADYLNSHIAGSRIELFRNCGHLPFLTQPQKFNKIINEFLG